ncbi:MAG: hypothetical protein PHW34_00890 [Hespellia sp.]|nr:hypothetical protein [Hespellia sp.]
MKSWMDSKKECNLQAADTLPLPDDVVKWLQESRLLYDVPFSYLVPDENFLPMETIRFFQLDENWLDAMTEGACSIGGGTTNDWTTNGYFLRRVKQSLPLGLYRRRREKMHQNHLVHCALPTDLKDSKVRMGFLLRSELVEAYPGMKVEGWDRSSNIERNLLRLNLLSDTVMLGIFDGYIDEINVTEPSEALHFGTRTSDRKIYVRRIEEEGPYKIGDKLSEELIPVPIRDGRMVDVSNLVETLKKKLHADDFVCGEEVQQKPAFTSAELALEMVEMAAQERWTKQ